MTDLGYTKHKMRQLERNYINPESRDTAVHLWERRKKQGKYGSVGFHCYNHLIKGHGHNSYWNRVNDKMAGKPVKGIAAEDIKPSSLRASVMGPCVQAVTLTLLKKGETQVDLFYRTTELFKKFPADLVFLREVLLKPFDVAESQINFHFANATAHPMYWVTLVPMMRDPIADLQALKRKDRYFWEWVVKWTARYLCDEFGRGIDKFAQACRVRDGALSLIKEPDELIAYLRKNHPGFRNANVS